MYRIEIENEVQRKIVEFINEEMIETERDPAEIAAEEQSLIDAKVAEIQPKIDAYKAAQQYQIENGGPGPVAEFEIMKIVNEYDGQFEVIFKEQ
jgi:hypothetical protein